MNSPTAQPVPHRQPTPPQRVPNRTSIRIERAPHNEQHTFVQLNTAVIRALPVASLGMLAKLLAFADGWDIDEDRLERDYNVTPGVIRATHKDLRERGHLNKAHVRGKGNRITGSVWTVKEAPQIHAANIRSVEAHSEENHSADGHPQEIHDAGNLPDGGTVPVEGARASLYPLSKNLLVPEELEDQEPPSLNAGARAGEGGTSFVPPLHKYLLDFFPKLGEPNGHRELLEAEIARLGDNEARDVLLGCDSAQSWQYLLTSLRNRATPMQQPPPSSAPPPSGEPLMAVAPITYPPLGAAWVTACQFIPLEAARLALSFRATITEPDVQVVRVEAGPFDGDLLAADGVQDALAMMRDMDIRVEVVQHQPECAQSAWTPAIDEPPVIRWLDRDPLPDYAAVVAWAKVCRQLPQLERATKLTEPVSLVDGVLTIRVTYDRAYASLTNTDRHLVNYAARDALGDDVDVRFVLAEKAGAA